MSHRTLRTLSLCAVLAALGVGCPSSPTSGDAGGRDAHVSSDAALLDDAATGQDTASGSDARAASPHRMELTPAAGRVQGGGFQVDFQLGHSSGQNKLGDGTHSTEGAAAVKP